MHGVPMKIALKIFNFYFGTKICVNIHIVYAWQDIRAGKYFNISKVITYPSKTHDNTEYKVNLRSQFWKHVTRVHLLYTGCNRRNGPDFGRVFLRSYYTDITQNTYIQSSMVTEILAREVWNFYSYYSLIDYQIHIETGRNMWFL